MTFAIWTVCQFAMPSLLAFTSQLFSLWLDVTAPSTKLVRITHIFFVQFLRLIYIECAGEKVVICAQT